MATYAGHAGLAGKIQGLREAKRAFQALPEVTREAMLAATELTARELARAAQDHIARSPSIRTRSLYHAIAWKVTKTNGRAKVGVSAGRTTYYNIQTRKRQTIKGTYRAQGGQNRLIRPDRYAHFVEFGTRTATAEPFMIPAADSQKGPFLDRCRAAGRKIEQNTAAIGARSL